MQVQRGEACKGQKCGPSLEQGALPGAGLWQLRQAGHRLGVCMAGKVLSLPGCGCKDACSLIVGYVLHLFCVALCSWIYVTNSLC